MAIAYLIPAANGSYTTFSLTGCSVAYQCIDDPSGSPDEDTTSLSRNVLNSRQSVTFGSLNATQASIASVTILTRCKKPTGTASIKNFVRIGGVDYDGTGQAITSAYANYTEVWATNPATGQAWTVADINSLEAGLLISAISGAISVFLTQLYVTVTFTPGLDYKLDGLSFTCGPTSKRWSQQQIARKGNVEAVFAAFWQLDLTFGDRPVSDATFFEQRWFAGGLHTISAPHPETGIMTGFTGVAIRDVSYGFTDIDRNTWVDSLSVTFGRIWLGATGSV